uniref:transposase n=1 Tax=Wolbachia pipientis TaxID=955 RepID=UPI0035C2140F
MAVCHPKRTSRNKVFKGLAKIGKTTYGRFFGTSSNQRNWRNSRGYGDKRQR